MKCVIVDDELEHLNICKKFANELRGFSVVGFQSPMKALRYIQSNYVDMIILDWRMPELNGSIFIDQLKKMELDNMPEVVICSAENDSNKVLEMIGQGIVGYIVKPYKKDALQNQLRLIQQRQADNAKHAVEMWKISSGF